MDSPGTPVSHDSSPLAEFLKVGQDGNGTCRISIDPVHLSPNGTMHGGALFTMFDTAMGTAAAGYLAEGQMCVTMEIQIRYLKPIFEGDVEVRGSVLHPGKRIIQTEARATNGDRTVASATGSFVVLDRERPTPA
ncbi:MAG: PaaI family thioesterase [Acidimicrobiia bacterium]|nr:PaaI family thioesterase [Actinomycetota bacterium]MBL6925993.1 PaaI family thioesterase [Acidimicrobiia bacterium]